MLTPKVGMSVWYYPGSKEVIPHEVGKPLAATVCCVHDENLVNLSILGADASRHSRLLVAFGGPDASVDDYVGYCTLPDSEDEKADPIDAEFEVDNSLRDFFLRTVTQLIDQQRFGSDPMEAAEEAWAVTQYVREKLEDLK